MAVRLRGAYVQAWVWVDLEADNEDWTDDEIVYEARLQLQRYGELEIDDGAEVSRSYEYDE